VRPRLITDQAVSSTAATYADYRPPLDPISRQAINQDHHSAWDVSAETRAPEFYFPAPAVDADEDDEDADDVPEVVLWAALVTSPPEGTTVPDLVADTGMSRPWVYLRLRELADRGQVIQVSRGRWRAAASDDA
jgi:S-DNA-T family DNA segregation ATPase FtsK/SpoIIIE